MTSEDGVRQAVGHGFRTLALVIVRRVLDAAPAARDFRGDGVGGGVVHVLDDALVGVAGQGGGGVAELFGDDLDIDPGVQGDGGGAVSQVVQPDRGQPGLADEFAEALGDGVGVPGLSVGADEE